MTQPRQSSKRGEPAADELFNRDVSWLAFNQRVLELAEDETTPLLERVKFLSIFANNLDEFFMKRVGLIRRQVDAGIEAPSPDGLTPRQQLDAVRSAVIDLQERQAACWDATVIPALDANGVAIVPYDELDGNERQRLDTWFEEQVFPILTPLSIDPGHRFPFISNLSENLGVLLAGNSGFSGQPASSDSSHGRFCRLKIPDGVPRLVRCDDPDGRGDAARALAEAGRLRFTPLDQVMRANLALLFPGVAVLATNAFRVTRSAAVEVEDEGDLLQSVQEELRQRRFARPVRMELAEQPHEELATFFATSLGLQSEDVYARRGPLEYGDLMELAALDLPQLKEKPWTPLTPPRFIGVDVRSGRGDIFAAIRERDIIAHHPYESFDESVRAFVSAASRDPAVLAIKQTIYRTSRDSPFVRSLIRAAENGKQVACMVELRARFDESRNVSYARRLEHAGVHVAYGIVGLKTHAKCSLVVRREKGGLRTYAHLGTGNYHPHTAQLYTDLSLLTCDPRITGEVAELFNAMTGFSLKADYEHLLVAPTTMRPSFERLIDAEIEHAKAGRPARIFAKLNSMEDRKITAKLYEASQAGVQIDLCVRGFCCLRPGVPGLSENIRVVSVVGRFLEHSRIFHFSDGHEDPLAGHWFMGSADWMYRNLNNRLESICPIYDEAARGRLAEIMLANLHDHDYAWDLGPDGDYQRRPRTGVGTFERLMRSAETGHANAVAAMGDRDT
ncbi:MAG: polyphosphate kinase 1 [Phycisphaerales bacterium]|nr:polyphosphate kinase 1 [Phycisphaerales bacterium]